ncbi:polymorphic toxin-type HINT domain-containing protein [Streptomyces sp. NPDC002073]
MSGSLTPIATAAAAGLPGAPSVPKARDAEVRNVGVLGANALRDQVAKTKADNRARERRALAEADSHWPAAAVLTQDIATAGTGTRKPLVRISPGLQGKGLRATTSATGKATVRVHDQKAAARAGIDGVLLSATAEKPGSARISVDYGSFASAIGGGWSTRLGMVALPACALTTPQKAECRQTAALPSTNRLKGQTVTGSVSLPRTSPQQPAVFAVMATSTSSPSGAGDIGATPLGSSSTWQAGGSAGAFSWSYPLVLPPAAAGPAPQLGLNYSSAAVDGRTASTNNQSSLVGEGFDLTSSYIERRYGSCDDDGQKDKFDLCWKYDNATLVLNGKSTELVKDDTTGTWRLKDDDGSKITQAMGAENGAAGGEHWKVTTGDGTVHTFGLNKLTGADTERTNSTWTVPVYGDDSGEPGYDQGSSFSGRAKTQAWRWNLDLVEDVHGNAMSWWYTAETNYYAQNGNKAAPKPYIRGGYPTAISYGQRASTLFTANASHRVKFAYKERCFVSTCVEPTLDTKENWPDVPFDSICSATETDCKATGPAFFTRKRLDTVKTYAWSTAFEPDTYAYIDSYDLEQALYDGQEIGGTADQTIVLKSILRTGRNGTDVPLPPVEFAYHGRPNRVDTDSDNVLALIRPRINTIVSETGAITTVTTSNPECVRGTNMPKAEDDNSDASKPCYPVYWAINGGDTALDWFHKYRVVAVSVADPKGQNPLVQTAYEYEKPGWHYNDDPLTKESERTWSSWRGYGKVTTLTGAPNATRSKTVQVFMQGLHGDKLKAAGTTRTAVVTGVDVPGATVADANDLDQFAGFMRQELTYDGSTPLSMTVNSIWDKETASQQKSYANVKAYYIRTNKVSKRTYLSASGTWRRTQTDTMYDDTYGTAIQVAESGDTAVTGDETCTRTWYARNVDKGLTNLASRARTVATACTDTAGATITDDKLDLPATSATRGDVISDTATVYDDATVTGWTPNQKPTLGLATWTGRAKAYPAASGTAERHPAENGGWQTVSTVGYDTATAKLGRPISVTDAAGRTTTTAYTPAAGGPLTVAVVTSPKISSNGQEHKTYNYADLRGAITTTFDANLKERTSTYDGLGRITATWLPNRSKAAGDTPNVTYAYSMTKTAEPWTSVSTLKADGTSYNTKYSISDALLRPLQTQVESPNGGRILTDTRYDSRGLTYETYASIWDKDKAPQGTYARAEFGGAQNQAKTIFDGAGRAVESTFLVYGDEKWSTTTSYTGNSVASTAVQGGTASRTITDALGRTTETRTYAGTDPNDTEFGDAGLGTPYTSVSYTYTRDGKPADITGPDKSKWSYKYDLFGRQVSAEDPDKGLTTTTYNALDQVDTTKDALKAVLAYSYDELGRKTGLWKTSRTDANKLAAWTYDTLLKGAPTAAIRYEGGTTGKAYTQQVTGYDTLGRAVKSQLTLPTDDPLVTAGAIAATTESQVDYRLDGTVSTTTDPAAGGLPKEVLTHHYNAFGLPDALTGTTDYVQNVAYSPIGQVLQTTLARSSAAGVRKTFVGSTYEDGTGRLIQSTVNDQTHSGRVQDLTYSYDQAGNIKSIFDAAPLSAFTQADNQCFTYDAQRRLTDAWTPKTADCSVTGRTAANLGGAAPYWTSYTYNAAGQRATEKTNTGTPSTRTYCYDPARPHTLAATTTGASCTGVAAQYQYDANGNSTHRVEKPGSSAAQTLLWGPEGKLNKLTEGTATTDYVYDANGQLLIRRNAGGETILYAGATEVHLKGTKKWAVRYYSLAGSRAMRTTESGTSKLSFLAGDHHGTSSLSIDGEDTQALSKRYSTPFGASRGTPVGTWPDDKRFLGAPEDTTTGLTHIGAREYDPGIGQFINVDPLLELDRHQTLNGYSYAQNNPISFSDPTGMGLDDGTGHTERTDGEQGQGDGVTVGGHRRLTQTQWVNKSDEGAIAAVVITVAVRKYLDPRAQADWNKRYYGELKRRSAKQGGDLTAMDRIGDGENVCFRMKDACSGQMQSYLNYLWFVHAAESGGSGKNGAKRIPTRSVSPLKRGLASALKKLCESNSFTGNTRVLMGNGRSKPISQVKIGDLVMATDPKTGRTAAKKVTKEIVGQGQKHLTRVTIQVDQKLVAVVATDGHPFWVPELGKWIAAKDLNPRQYLETSAGTRVQVTAIERWTQTARVYNLTVADFHTYYAIAGATALLVHNCNTEIKNVALGTSDNGLEDFADDHDYTHFMGETQEGALANVRDVANEHPETNIHVRLDGFTMTSGKRGTPAELFDDAVREGQGGNWYTTQREMAILERAYRVGNLGSDRLFFYMGGRNITSEIFAGSRYLGGS